MRAKEFILNEIGDKGAEYQPHPQRRRSQFSADVGGHDVTVFFDRSSINGSLQITFTVDGDYELSAEQAKRKNLPVFKILSTVLKIIREKLPEYMKQYQPERVSFTAKGERSRASVYEKFFVPLVTEILGPKFIHEKHQMHIDDPNSAVFLWRKPWPWEKSESEKVTEAKACGDCFKVAGRSMIAPEVPEMRLVHAYVTGQGSAEGKRFSHAWNEIGDVVLDYSNGRQIIMRKPQYYELGQVSTEPGEYAVYNDTEAKKKMVQTKHWGPWDLDPSKENIDEDYDSQSKESAIHLRGLGRFFKDKDPLVDFVPERGTHTFALHPDKWINTFYSLTNKDPKKLSYYKPAKIDIVPGTLVADMYYANRFYQAKNEQEKAEMLKLYKDSLKPYEEATLQNYKMPELLIPKS